MQAVQADAQADVQADVQAVQADAHWPANAVVVNDPMATASFILPESVSDDPWLEFLKRWNLVLLKTDFNSEPGIQK